MFALIYFDMGTCFYMFEQKVKNFKIVYTKYKETCEAMRSSTHWFAYIVIIISIVQEMFCWKLRKLKFVYSVEIIYNGICTNSPKFIDPCNDIWPLVPFGQAHLLWIIILPNCIPIAVPVEMVYGNRWWYLLQQRVRVIWGYWLGFWFGV